MFKSVDTRQHSKIVLIMRRSANKASGANTLILVEPGRGMNVLCQTSNGHVVHYKVLQHHYVIHICREQTVYSLGIHWDSS